MIPKNFTIGDFVPFFKSNFKQYENSVFPKHAISYLLLCSICGSRTTFMVKDYSDELLL